MSREGRTRRTTAAPPAMGVRAGVCLDEAELSFHHIRASGPGGQKVNKAATAVQLRFDIRRSKGLPEPVRERLALIAGKRVSADGILVIDARRFRTQQRNRCDAIERLRALIERAARTPKPRRATRPSRAARARRLESKRRRADLKRLRRGPTASE